VLPFSDVEPSRALVDFGESVTALRSGGSMNAMTVPGASAPASPWRLGDVRSWVVAFVVGVVAYSATSGELLFLEGRWQLPLFVGLLVGLAAVLPWQGATVSLICVLGGMLIAPPVISEPVKLGAVEYLLAILLAVAGGALPSYLRSLVQGTARKRLTLAMSAVLVAWILVNLWLPLTFFGLPPQTYGTLQATTLREAPVSGQFLGDEALFRRVFFLMHEGERYYKAYHDAWLGYAQHYPLPNTPVGVRLPTYFWLWQALPPDPFAIVYLYLAFISVGTVAAATIAGQLVGPRLAPLGALTFGAYAVAVGYGTSVVFVDLPSMSVALVGISLYLLASRSRKPAHLWAAVAVLAVAALTREILAYLLVLGACSAFLEAKGERLRRAIPWLAGLAVFATGYALHAWATWPYIDPTSTQLSYAKGSVAFAYDALFRFSGGFKGHVYAVSALVVLGVAGAAASRRRAGAPFAAFAMAAVVLPFVAMLFYGNSVPDATGQVYNYWGTLVLPTAFALWPASALLLWQVRAEGAGPGSTTPEGALDHAA
jgi:hypothetical protein